jgi:hypothetical protein
MNALEYVAQGRIALRGDRTLRVEDDAGTAVHVWHGEIRITQDRGVTVIRSVGEEAIVSLAGQSANAGVERIVLTGIGSKGPLRLAPTGQPELVGRLLARLGLVRTEAKAA